MIVPHILVTVALEMILFGAAGAIDNFLPVPSLWTWLGCIVIGAIILFAIWRKKLFGTSRASSSTKLSKMARTSQDAPQDMSDAVLPPAPTTASVEHILPSDRVYTPRTASEIFLSIHKLTSLEADNAMRPYIGKWLKIEGVVRDVSDYRDIISIHLDLPETKEIDLSLGGISLRFKKDRWMQHIETIKKGDFVKAVGIIDRIDRWTMSLEDCELIEVKGKATMSAGSLVDTPAKAPKADG